MPALRFRTMFAPLMLALGGCASDGATDGLQRRLESDLRRSCLAHVTQASAESTQLMAARLHAACVHWAHRQAERLAP
jgi:hypothetical protein